jgi:hypothetical protein
MPCSWVRRNVLENAGAESTPESVDKTIDAFVSKGDRFGTAIRRPGEVAPTLPNEIVAQGTTEHSVIFRANEMTLDVAMEAPLRRRQAPCGCRPNLPFDTMR